MKSFNEITSRKELAEYLGIKESTLNYVLYVGTGVSKHYKSFEIPKKSGGVRNINAPIDPLKMIQRKLAIKLSDIREEKQKEIKKYKCVKKTNKKLVSHGFERGKTIITNAELHRNKRYVVNIDLKDFFGSFHFGRVRGYFNKNKDFKLPLNIATVIAQLTCYNGVLPQGAPTSPIITNMICNILDLRILKVANKYKLNYTRYADDLTFSTNYKGFYSEKKAFFDEIRYEVENFGLYINDSKTRVLYKDSRQEVTGLVVNKKINVKREYYKKNRAMAYELYKTGSFFIDGEEGSINQLEGRFNFVNQLNIYNNKPNNITNKFKNLDSKEKEYQKLLFYMYFIANERPLIITEGKTDILYLKSAMRKYYSDYPELIEEKNGKFKYNVMFLKRVKKLENKRRGIGKEYINRLNYFLGISEHGGATFKNIFDLYNDSSINLGNFFFNKIKCTPKNPVFLVFDNEQKKKSKGRNPLADFKNKAGIEERIDILKRIDKFNLYVLTNPIQECDEVIEAEIEDLFEKSLLEMEILGRKFSREDKFNKSENFGKDEFSKYVYNNYKNINFENFIPMLDEIKKVVNEYKEDALSNCT